MSALHMVTSHCLESSALPVLPLVASIRAFWLKTRQYVGRHIALCEIDLCRVLRRP